MYLFIRRLCKKIDLCKECENDFFFFIKKCICVKKELKSIITNFSDKNFYFEEGYKKFCEITTNLNINSFKSSLFYVLLLTKKLKKKYGNLKINNKIYYDTMKDITYKVNECKLVEGEYGLMHITWFERIFNLKVFALGRLEFEISKLQCDVDGLKKGTQTIGVHIPRNGERLLPILVDESIQNAIKFFNEKFEYSEFIFTCESWLLNPDHQYFLAKDSNIMKFAARFKTIYYYELQNYDELWRIFDCKYNGLSSLKGSSSLTNGYINIVRNNEKLKMGVGYFKI